METESLVSAVSKGGLTEKDHARVARYVEAVAGIQLPSHKRALIEGRLRKRQKQRGFEDMSGYIAHVFDTSDHNEMIMLIDAITTNKTEFFREPVHFEVLEEQIRKRVDRAERASETPLIRIWSAGCSTGEEPYSIAILCNEIREKFPALRFEILASDISVTALGLAKRGVYADARIGPISETLRRKYLYRSKDPQKKLVKMGEKLQQAIQFFSLNLIQDDYHKLGEFDFIFCRNVMIYFCLEDRIKIIDKFRARLNASGILFLGHSETLPERNQCFNHLLPTVYQKQR